MPTLSENDPEPTGPSGPPVWLVALIVAVVFASVVLHLTGVVGPG
jgi:antibiotic biosynthesis monooxygenase (ABM) superfamily enzyme